MDSEEYILQRLSLDDAYLEADARLVSLGYGFEPPKLTALQIQAIETTLPIYDQIAFIFLAHRDPQEALCQIKNVTEVHAVGGAWQNCVIGPWIRAQGLASRATVIEILHVLQNFKLLRTLGAETIEQIVHVDNFRYSLFKVIEKLDNMKIEILTLKVDGQASVVNYMEAKILTWICEGKLGPRNCLKFISVLREIGLLKEAENLEETVRILNEPNVSAQYENNTERPSITLNAPPSLTSETYKIKPYSFNPRTAGLCVIINQRNFNRMFSAVFPDRHGTDRDCHMLVSTFRMFGLQTEVWQNLSSSELKSCVQVIAERDLSSSDILVVCLLSHGVKGAIISTDGLEVNVTELKAIVARNVTLAGKPKLFFVQACQGVTGQGAVQHNYSDITTDGQTLSSPELSDFCEAWATVPGFVSYRSKRQGSHFIQTVCRVLQECGHELVFEDVMKKVNEIVSYIDNRLVNSVALTKQMPEYSSSFRRSLRFARHEDLFIDAVAELLEDRMLEYLTEALTGFVLQMTLAPLAGHVQTGRGQTPL